MKHELDCKVSIGRYNNVDGKCYVDIDSDGIIPRVLAEMEQSEFAKAITGMGERRAKLTLWVNDEKIDINQQMQVKTDEAGINRA